ncbi:hypothetical protein C8E95_5170 [Pseudonocardia autotrophica]|uniref:Uncharacterized protein n=1 Tax=Pseudonocardia autotrophica TaxID=2074 RepID=A0A1Y2N4T0_PSEAH|nr:hypothetical protein BG845_01385 [Pseudonocardia autotrophica]TDN75985.1 hypothetical protein C8E95_5170 [Pseudonocardia autotrophica]
MCRLLSVIRNDGTLLGCRYPCLDGLGYQCRGCPNGPERVTGNVRKILILVAVALGIFLVVTAPQAAANSVTNIGNILYDAAQSVSTFVTSLL